MSTNYGHVALLGDSIFDNAAYVGAGPDVIRQVRERLPQGSKATLCARDGSVTSDVRAQIDGIPADTDALVISAGGNDAIGHSGILDRPARSSADVFDMIYQLGDLFRSDYGRMLTQAMERGLPVTVCTIYHPRFPDPTVQRRSVAALGLFNDVILRQAFAAGLPVIDLRLICTDDADYANPIEPSAIGGAKIADAIATVLRMHDFATGRTTVFCGGAPKRDFPTR